MKTVLCTEVDDERNIWLDAVAPIQLTRENAPPHRIAVRGQLINEENAKSGFYLRLTRPDAYRLIDQLQSALAADTQSGAEPITKRTRLAAPVNGGVNRETGEMILVFKGQSGLDHQILLPFDQSGALLEIVERAAKTASEWHDAQLAPDLAGIQKVEIQPREAESVMLAEDPTTERPILIVRLDGGHQFSFFVDRKIVEQLIKKPKLRAAPFKYPTDPWNSIADDIQWFQTEWCTLYEPPSDAEIRRGSAALRRLLVEDWLGKAWRHCGFERQPLIAGPDVLALTARDGLEIRHIASLIAGGATINGIQTAMIGIARVDNVKTGVGADAEEGFAVKQFQIARDARGESEDNELAVLVNKNCPLSNYLDAPGAVRRGEAISRRDIVSYFANMAGGVHLGPSKSGKEQTHALVQELINKIRADIIDGLFFELLSIGQAIGRSDDLKKLVDTIRAISECEEHARGSNPEGS